MNPAAPVTRTFNLCLALVEFAAPWETLLTGSGGLAQICRFLRDNGKPWRCFGPRRLRNQSQSYLWLVLRRQLFRAKLGNQPLHDADYGAGLVASNRRFHRVEGRIQVVRYEGAGVPCNQDLVVLRRLVRFTRNE